MHLEFNREDFLRREDDAQAIVDIFAENGCHISSEAAYLAWRHHSDTSAASWLSIDGCKEVVFNSIRFHALEIEDELQATARAFLKAA